MSMVPGFGSNTISKGSEKEAAAKIRKYLFMIDSMSIDELENRKPLN